MGSTCAKSDQSMEKPEEADGAAPEKSKEKGENSPTPSTNGESPGKESSSPDKKKNFRQRRLSVDQQRDPSAKGAARHRRLSVYGQTAGQEQANPDVTVSLKSCGCKSVGGMEPVPGGARLAIRPRARDASRARGAHPPAPSPRALNPRHSQARPPRSTKTAVSRSTPTAPTATRTPAGSSECSTGTGAS